MRQRPITLVMSALSMLAVVSGCARDDRTAPATSPAAAFIDVDESAGPTDAAIATAQDALRREPTNRKARLALAQAFLQKARETADPSLYGKADQLLSGLDDEDDADPGVLVAQGTLALARHEFADALRIGRAALELAPGNQGALGVIVDASNELGRYDDGVAVTQQMVDAKPNLASLSRVSYAREIHGDLRGAVQAMTEAALAGGSAGGENVAYVQTQLGVLLLTTGDIDGAIASFDAAEQAFPGFVPAKVGRARVLIAQGDLDDADALLTDAIAVQPLAESVALQGDVLTVLGDDAAAARAYDLVGAIAELNRANGVRTDLEMALFTADHDPGDDGVAAARVALRARPSIFGHDVLAWNLFRAGDIDAAWAEMQDALVTGSRDPQLRFHAASIAAAVGDDDAAREHLVDLLDTNPRFNPLHADDITALAADLGVDQSNNDDSDVHG